MNPTLALVLLLAMGAIACSSESRDAQATWATTGDHAAFPAPLAVDQATAITIDAAYMYWINAAPFLYRAPRAGGDVERVTLPAPGVLIGAHNDVFVGWTGNDGNAAVADIDPATGNIKALNHQSGALRGLIAGQRGYGFASAAPDGTLVQTCHDDACNEPLDIPSDFLGLALDFPTLTFYVLTLDGLRTCTLATGCPGAPTPTPASTRIVAALPGTHFLLTANGQAFDAAGSPLGTAAVQNPKKLWVVDGNNGPSPVGTWSNGAQLAQTLMAPGATTTTLATACSDFEVDASGRPIYCLVDGSTVQTIP